MRKIFLITLVVALAVSAQTVPDGTYSGKLQMGVASLPLNLNFKGETVTLDSPAQGAKDIPATLIFNDKDSISIGVPMIGAVISGTMRGDTIDAVLSQRGVQLPLLFVRGGGQEISRPQTPKAPFPYTTRDITFTNPADGAVLAGTITLPDSPREGFPALVMVTGSGLQNRDEELFGHKPFAVIADALARNGIATLRYDDRGTGGSQGDVADATTSTFAGDARAAAGVLRDVKGVGKVGVLGHSEGGTIALMLAAEGTADMAVSLAGALVPGLEIIGEQNRDALARAGLPAQVADDGARLVMELLARPGADVDSIINALHLSVPPQVTGAVRQNAGQANAWLLEFVKIDPSQWLSKVKVPVMVANGELDSQVKSDANLAVARRELPGAVIRSYPGLNHLFQHAVTGDIEEYQTITETISPEVLEDISLWVNSVSR